jgi:hypothetical protein
MNTIASKISTTSNELLKIDKRIKELESQSTQLAFQLQQEIISRQKLESSSLSHQSGFSSQIQTLKEGIEQLGQVVNESIDDFKKNILHETSEKNAKIKAYIDDKTKLFNYYDKKVAENDFTKQNFENEIKNKLYTIESTVKNSIQQIKDEVALNSKKLERFEKVINDNYSSLKSEIDNISKEMMNIKNDLICFNNFRNSTVENFKAVQSDLIHQDETMTNFVNRVNCCLREFENKSKDYENSFLNQNETFMNVKDEIYRHIEIIDTKLNSKIKELDGLIYKQSKLQCSEIDNFEKHMLSEQENFTRFIQGRFDEQNASMKQLIDYLGDDIRMIKNKVDMRQHH